MKRPNTIDPDLGPELARRLLETDATTADLARELDVCRNTVSKAVRSHVDREALRLAALRKMARSRRGRPELWQAMQAANRVHDFSGVDWSSPDHVIARALGCSASHVGGTRAALGKPPSPDARRHRTTMAALLPAGPGRTKRERAIVRRLLGTDASVQSLAAELGCAVGTVYAAYVRHTTPEQRREAKARKLRKRKAAEPSGWAARLRAGVRAGRQCAACGGPVRRGGGRCPKCGCDSSEVVAVAFSPAPAPAAESPPDTAKSAARRNLSKFLEELEAA